MVLSAVFTAANICLFHHTYQNLPQNNSYVTYILRTNYILGSMLELSTSLLAQVLPRALNLRRPSSHNPPHGLESVGTSWACSPTAPVHFPKSHTWDSRILHLNLHWIRLHGPLTHAKHILWFFFQRADFAFGLLTPRAKKKLLLQWGRRYRAWL